MEKWVGDMIYSKKGGKRMDTTGPQKDRLPLLETVRKETDRFPQPYLADGQENPAYGDRLDGVTGVEVVMLPEDWRMVVGRCGN